MLPRFPQDFSLSPEVKLAHIGKTVAAFFKILERFDRVEGFLTENTLLFVLKGVKRIHLPEQVLEIREGDLVLLKRGTYFMSTFFTEDEYQGLMLCMDDEFLKGFLNRYTQLQAQPPAQPYAPLVMPCDGLLHDVRNSIVLHLQQQTEVTNRLLQLKLEELFLLLLSGTQRPRIEAFLQQVFDYSAHTIELVLKANLLRPFSIEEYAKLCGLSLSGFKREFARRYEASPREWISRERLKHAEFLFNTTNKNVNEVALECGFENTSYFIRLYRRQYGTTPKQAQRSKSATF